MFVAIAAMGEVVVEEAGPLGSRTVRDVVERIGDVEGIADSVEALYRMEGYLYAEVAANTDTVDGVVTTTIRIDAGSMASVERYSVEGFPGAMPELSLKVGKTFREAALAWDMESLVEDLEDRGFPFASAEIESFLIDVEARVRVSIAVNPRDSVEIGALILPNKIDTKGYVVERTMLLHFPELYSQGRIEKGIERLDDLSYLSVFGKPDIVLDESGVWALRMDVVEGRTILIDGVLGYAPKGSGKGELSGQLDAVFANLWGTGRNLSFHWIQSSNEYLRVQTAFTEPWLFSGPGAMTVDGEYYRRDSIFTENSFSIKYSWPVSFVTDISVGGGYRGVMPDSAGQVSSGIANSKEFNLDFGCSIGRLKPRVNPKGGFDLSIVVSPSYIERRGPEDLFESIERFEAMARIEGDAEAAQSIGRNSVAFLGLHGRSALSGGPLPISDGYYMGGWGSVRGFREEQFFAENLGWGNFEWRLLLGGDAHGFAFIDGGLTRPSGGEYDLHYGYGIGARISTAIGWWSVSYGVAGGESITGGMIHVGLKTEL